MGKQVDDFFSELIELAENIGFIKTTNPLKGLSEWDYNEYKLYINLTDNNFSLYKLDTDEKFYFIEYISCSYNGDEVYQIIPMIEEIEDFKKWFPSEIRKMKIRKLLK